MTADTSLPSMAVWETLCLSPNLSVRRGQSKAKTITDVKKEKNKEDIIMVVEEKKEENEACKDIDKDYCIVDKGKVVGAVMTKKNTVTFQEKKTFIKSKCTAAVCVQV